MSIQLHPYPTVGCLHADPKRGLRFPLEYLPQEIVVAVAAMHTLRLGSVMNLTDLFARDRTDQINQLVNRDKLGRS